MKIQFIPKKFVLLTALFLYVLFTGIHTVYCGYTAGQIIELTSASYSLADLEAMAEACNQCYAVNYENGHPAPMEACKVVCGIVETAGCVELNLHPSGAHTYTPDTLDIVGAPFKRCLVGNFGSDGCGGMNPPQAYRSKMSGKCGCPSEPVIKIDGCHITVSCGLEDDERNVVTLDIPCPTVAGTDPKYPLVRMLSGTLVEWRVGDKVEAPHEIKYTVTTNPEGYGTEVFQDFKMDIIVSTVDTGPKFDIEKAEIIVKNTEKHSRDNLEFTLIGGNPNVKVLSAKDIYDAYKNRSEYVQAYTVLAGKGYKERPWASYDSFVKAMCKMSESPKKCERALLGIDYENFKGNYYLGNGNPTILGVYSDISSHGCHGSTVLDDKGEPAFGIKFKSTFCIYFHASWGDHYTYGNQQAKYIGECCAHVVVQEVFVGKQKSCFDDSGRDCWEDDVYIVKYLCMQYKDIWSCIDGFNGSGGGESSEDCKQCIEIEGWLDTKGKLHTDPYPVSFYQSQPLLISGK